MPTARPRSPRSRALTVVTALTATALTLATTAFAGTVVLDGTTARFSDPGGADDRVQLTFERGDDGFWTANLFSATGPAIEPGAGCAVGSVGFDCPTGATAPTAHVDLGAGDDELDITARTFAPGRRAIVQAGPGDDTVTKYATGADVDLGPGDDTVYPDHKGLLPPPATPGDVIRGGTGTDTVDYSDAIDPITVSLDGRANDGRKGERDNVLSDVENVVGSEFGGDIVGSDAANVLRGPGADRRIVGAGGRDRLIGSGILDALDGRGGDRVECLGRTDVAWADSGDIVDRDCAKIIWAPAVKGGSTLRAGRGRRVSVALACPAGARTGCSGALRLVTTRGVKLASGRYAISRGRTTTVSLRLARTTRGNASLLVAPKGTAPIAGRSVRLR